MSRSISTYPGSPPQDFHVTVICPITSLNSHNSRLSRVQIDFWSRYREELDQSLDFCIYPWGALPRPRLRPALTATSDQAQACIGRTHPRTGARGASQKCRIAGPDACRRRGLGHADSPRRRSQCAVRRLCASAGSLQNRLEQSRAGQGSPALEHCPRRPCRNS
jgi:hypothetical protein